MPLRTKQGDKYLRMTHSAWINVHVEYLAPDAYQPAQMGYHSCIPRSDNVDGVLCVTTVPASWCA